MVAQEALLIGEAIVSVARQTLKSREVIGIGLLGREAGKAVFWQVA